jgi:hypothetical protein
MSRERISTRRSSLAGASSATNLSPLRVMVMVLNSLSRRRRWRAASAAGRSRRSRPAGACRSSARGCARHLVERTKACACWSFDAEAVEHRTQGVAGADAFFVDELLLVLLQGGDLVCQVRQLQVLGDRLDGEVGCVRRDRRDGGGTECTQCQGCCAAADDTGLAARSSRPNQRLPVIFCIGFMQSVKIYRLNSPTNTIFIF